MTMKARALLVGVVLLAEMSLVGCGHYVCDTTFGSGTCSSGGGGGIGGGGGVTTSGTYLLIADAGGILGEVLDPTTKTLKTNPNFGSGQVPVGTTNVPGDWMVIANGKFMYTGYTATGEIWGWSLNGNGTITAINGLQPFSALYLLGIASAGTQAMVTNPAGTLLFVIDPSAATPEVNVYQIATDGGLTLSATIPLPLGFQPYNLAMDGQGKFLYISNIVGAATTEVAVANVTNRTVSSPVPMTLQQMQGESSGSYMIGTTSNLFGGENIVHVMGIDSSTGALTEIGTGMSTQDTPASVAVQPSTGGNLVYSIGFGGDVEGATLDSSTGTLTPVLGSPFSIQGLTGEFDPAGKYFFVVEGTNLDHANMFAYDVSASSSLTDSVASVGWAAGAWQPFDAK